MDLVHRTRIRHSLAAALVVACLGAPAAARADAIPERDEAVTVDQYLMGRVSASPSARGVIHLWTNTGYSMRAAVYPVLDRKTSDNGAEWVKVLVQRRPKNAEVWIPARATHRVWVSWRIQVSLSSRTVRIYHSGQLARRMRVVVGAPSTPTPTGNFYVVDHLRLYNNWAHGVWALATSAYSLKLKHFDGGDGVVAMHGRGLLPEPVGTAASHGCIRFNNGDIAWMASRIPNGTRIEITR